MLLIAILPLGSSRADSLAQPCVIFIETNLPTNCITDNLNKTKQIIRKSEYRYQRAASIEDDMETPVNMSSAVFDQKKEEMPDPRKEGFYMLTELDLRKQVTTAVVQRMINTTQC
ncbi:hypothetical protein ElyMa_005655900 [Elysia marginata]|uniref:Uncharacterized protein n=1 Tax=Elysia marginata TaxID=1093978 RepID=A0AAV4FDX6_9GAST|nr:hypothetical protein ElyMa_005655900 [Elysia marginata]